MDKTYNHKDHEGKIYRLWEKSGAFTPRQARDKLPFTIIMPPPNANDPLHIGHARFVTIQDILIRYHRMTGESTLWLPGSDHAGIETQYVFEKRLREKGKSRSDYDRDTLYKMIWDYVTENTGVMDAQLKKLGASCDWSRFKFTLDAKIVKIVYKTFKKLYDDGLIYRGERIVNYCPRCGTTFSELEINHVEREDPLYYLDYSTVTIATTRPETIFADVAIAVNPKDPRFKKLIGKSVQPSPRLRRTSDSTKALSFAKIPLIDREIPIISDSLVDPNFGTGALKVTPGHDAVDFEIGQKHKLPIISVIDGQGRMTSTPQKYIGMTAQRAREEIVRDLEINGKLKKIHKHKHVVGICYKHKTPIEPTVSKQWYLKVKPLVTASLKALNTGQVKFTAPRFEKIARNWFKNLRDWNISRQIVWGIRIPAWRCDKCLEWTITEGEVPKKCKNCTHVKLTQDTDTFDTWFSSGQWPFATLLSGKNSRFKIQDSRFIDENSKSDFNYFYPTSVMETGYDILPFWVIRMIMLGLYATGNVPFKEVLLHGLVRDANGEKISKSKGNVLDPIDMAEKYGADSLRMGIIWGTLVENDISLSEDNIRGQRNFSNKIWNVARYVFMDKTQNAKLKTQNAKPRVRHEDDKEILKEIKTTSKKVTHLLDKYRINEASKELYNFFWNKFANDYLEKTKFRRADAQKTLEYILQESLKILHPFMPFVTETIWQEGKVRFDSPTLISAPWPKHK